MKVKTTKIVKPKYRTKNNTTDPGALFLSTTKYIRANTKERTIFTPIATNVEKTLFSAFLTYPAKKISRAVNAIMVNPPERKYMSEELKTVGYILFRPVIARAMKNVKTKSKKYRFIASAENILLVSYGVLYYEPHCSTHAEQ